LANFYRTTQEDSNFCSNTVRTSNLTTYYLGTQEWGICDFTFFYIMRQLGSFTLGASNHTSHP